jgi:hypothetical protein
MGVKLSPVAVGIVVCVNGTTVSVAISVGVVGTSEVGVGGVSVAGPVQALSVSPSNNRYTIFLFIFSPHKLYVVARAVLARPKQSHDLRGDCFVVAVLLLATTYTTL